MSRCFPFPPPGYEKKARTDDVDLLKKEKHREKKHKKEKKDKDKREDKDKKDRDKSDGKHRDKKDKKEKSKEKKRDKERNKEKDKPTTSQENKISAESEICNGEYNLDHKERDRVNVHNINSNENKERDRGNFQNINSNEKKQGTPFRALIGEKPLEKSLYEEGSMDKFVLDLCHRIQDDEKGSASQSTERIPFMGRSNHDRMVKNEMGIIPVEKENKKDKRVDDIRKMDGQGVRVGAAISATALVQNVVGKWKSENKGANINTGGFQNKAEEIPRIFEKSIEPRDKNVKDRKVDNIRKMDNQGAKVGTGFTTGMLVQNIVGKEKIENKGVNISGGFQNKTEEIPKILEKSIEPRDKNHKKESGDKRGSKRTDKDKEKKSHGKDKERDREKKKEKKAKEKSDQKIKNHDKVKDSVKNGQIIGQNIKLPQLVSDGDRDPIFGQNIKPPQLVPEGSRNLVSGQTIKPVVSNGDRNLIIGQTIKPPAVVPHGERTPSLEGNLKKRKEIEANGFLHETNIGPNKKPRPTPHPWIENGRKLEPSQTPVLHTPDRKIVPPPNNLIKVNNTEHKINGKIEVPPLSISLKKPSSSSSSSSSRSKADQIAKAPQIKPPHPDTKYLSEVLSVPKIEEILDFGEEEWLFSSKDCVPLSSGPIKDSETPRVWAEAMQIESADVCALPYVIPY